MAVRNYEIVRKVTGDEFNRLAIMKKSPIDENLGISMGRLMFDRGFITKADEFYVVNHLSLSKEKELNGVKKSYEGYIQFRINTTNLFTHNGRDWLYGITNQDEFDTNVVFPSMRGIAGRDRDAIYILPGQMYEFTINICDLNVATEYERWSWYYRENPPLEKEEFVIVKFGAYIFNGQDAIIANDFLSEEVDHSNHRWRLKKSCIDMGMAPTDENVEKLVGKLSEP